MHIFDYQDQIKAIFMHTISIYGFNHIAKQLLRGSWSRPVLPIKRDYFWIDTTFY